MTTDGSAPRQTDPTAIVGEPNGDAVIVIVDDEPSNVKLLAHILRRAGYTNVHHTTRALDALPMFDAMLPDIVLLDLHMPEMNGFELMQQLRRRVPAADFVPVLMLTGDLSPGTRQRALAAGANDFVNKPFETGEVLLRMRNLLQTRVLHRELLDRNERLEQRVGERTRELEQARLDILDRLALAADFRDDATGEHTRRVGHLAEQIALELGFTADDANRLGRAAMLHDIGKIGIPDGILLKPSRLTPEEFHIIKSHVRIGRDILAGSPAPMLQVAEIVAFTHHERWDGAGYNGLVGDAIPIEGRIVTVADTFDVLTNERPYRQPCSFEDALIEMRAQRATQFDPDVLDAFLRYVERHGTDWAIP